MPSIRPSRTAELVADALRDEILNGALGDQLPKEDELRARFGVGKASIREALVILEAERLITVRRGKVGGSDVHLPTSASTAYSLGLVLTSDRVTIGELGDTLRLLEPECALLCAMRADRADTVVPQLRAHNRAMAEALDDGMEAVARSRRFHETLVSECGNGALSAVTGALERLWSAHEHLWAADALGAGSFPPMAQRRSALDFHEQIADHIERGDPVVKQVLLDHLDEAQTHTSSDRRARLIDISPLRSALDSPDGATTL